MPGLVGVDVIAAAQLPSVTQPFAAVNVFASCAAPRAAGSGRC